MTDGFTHDTDPPIEDVPEQPVPAAEPAPAVPPSDDVVIVPPAEEPVAPAEQLAAPTEAPQAAEPAAEDAADYELPEDLRAVTEALEQPTGTLSAVAAEGEAAEGAPTAEEAPAAEGEAAVEPGEGEAAAENAESEAAAEGAAIEEAEGEPAEGAEGESLDDIAPGTVAEAEGEEAAAEELEVQGPRMSVPWWPFIVYVLLWLAGAAYLVYELQLLPAGQAAYEAPLYHTSMLVALGMLAFGPVLALIVWIAAWIGYKSNRVGSLFISAFVKGAGSTLIGAIAWIAAIMITDYLRLGRPF